MPRPDLLVLVAVWQFITAFLALVGAVCIGAIAIPAVVLSGDPYVAVPLVFLSIPTVLLLCYAGVAVAGGVGLLLAREWGRIMSIVHAAFTLLWFPVGTVLGILVIIYLTKAEVRDYFKISSGR